MIMAVHINEKDVERLGEKYKSQIKEEASELEEESRPVHIDRVKARSETHLKEVAPYEKHERARAYTPESKIEQLKRKAAAFKSEMQQKSRDTRFKREQKQEKLKKRLAAENQRIALEERRRALNARREQLANRSLIGTGSMFGGSHMVETAPVSSSGSPRSLFNFNVGGSKPGVTSGFMGGVSSGSMGLFGSSTRKPKRKNKKHK